MNKVKRNEKKERGEGGKERKYRGNPNIFPSAGGKKGGGKEN